MLTNTHKSWLVAVLVTLVVVLDQAVKLYIKTHFTLGESVEVFSWWQICFVENNGMAFGIEWFSKYVLTLFRIVAVVVLCWYMHRLIAKQARLGYLITIALLTAGAMGNIFDCVLYGMIFSQSTPWEVATFVPWGQGYADLLRGRVVDMLYFPLIRNAAGETLFFRPVFNVADSFITCSVIAILLFFRKDLNDSMEEKVEG